MGAPTKALSNFLQGPFFDWLRDSLTLLVFRVLCILVFWELYPICTIHWINKLYPNPATA